MYGENAVAGVAPAYDEEGFVGEVIDTMPRVVDRVDAVDDCSTDRTWAEIRARTERPNDAERPPTDGDGRDPSSREEMSGWRPFGNGLLTMLTKIASGYWKMMDSQNEYTAVSNDALDLDAIFDGHGFADATLVHETEGVDG